MSQTHFRKQESLKCYEKFHVSNIYIYIYILKRFVLSAALAFLALTLFCYFYANDPVHYPDPDGATDYRWEPNAFYSDLREGFGFGKINNEGYYNIWDYDEGDQIDILMIGSSQMEAAQVPMSKSTASLLQSELDGLTVYNIGTSAHTFLTCASNFEKAVEKYHPERFVIVETVKLDFSDDELQRVIDGTYPELSSYAQGIVGILQRNPFLRVLYHQIKDYMAARFDVKSEKDDIAGDTAENIFETGSEYKILMNRILEKMKSDAKDADVVIFYHPNTAINPDGEINLVKNQNIVREFSDLCESNGVFFLDMSDRFEKEYQEHHRLPYGFFNTSVGKGHLNQDGHAMIADELRQFITGVD